MNITDDSTPLADEPSPPTAKKVPAKSARRRSREFALQGLYQWLVTGDEVKVIDAHMRELEGFGKADNAHFLTLLNGCIAEAVDLDAVLAVHVDRKKTEL